MTTSGDRHIPVATTPEEFGCMFRQRKGIRGVQGTGRRDGLLPRLRGRNQDPDKPEAD